MTRETSKDAKGRPGQILEAHDLPEDCARHVNFEGHADAFPNRGAQRLPNDYECV